jgi:uncharacterized protein (DUF2147 family)
VLGAAAPAFAASPLGMWKTPVREGRVELYTCGSALCGKVAGSPRLTADPNAKDTLNSNASLRDRPIKGLVFLTGFNGGPTEWKGGKVYNPEDGKTYSGTITLVNDDTLKLRGCVVFPLCKTQVWSRVK